MTDVRLISTVTPHQATLLSLPPFPTHSLITYCVPHLVYLLQELVMYGLKGLCAYAHHAEALGFTDDAVYAFVAEALTFLGAPESGTVPATLAMALRVGECNMRVMELLSSAHSST